MAKTVKPIPKPTRPRHYVREWRKHRGLTQETLAERIGKTHGAISQLERGLIDYTQGMLEALAYALRCEPGDLLSINPEKEGEVIDLTVLLRHAPPVVRQQAFAVVQTLLQTGTDSLAFPAPEKGDYDSPSQNPGSAQNKEARAAKR